MLLVLSVRCWQQRWLIVAFGCMYFHKIRFLLEDLAKHDSSPLPPLSMKTAARREEREQRTQDNPNPINLFEGMML